MALATVLGCCLLGWQGQALAASPPGSIDRLFGHGGYVDLTLAPVERFPGPGYFYAMDMETGPKGTIFVLSLGNECALTCQKTYVVTRYRSDGSIDSRYGDGGSALLSGGETTGPREGLLAVDSRGRASVAFAKEGDIEIARLGANGSRDASFGVAGQVSVADVTSTYALNRLFAAPGGGLVVESDWIVPRSSNGFEPNSSTVVVSIARLLSGGGPDRAFGDAGRSQIQLRHSLSPEAVAVTPGGAVVLAGSPCCPFRGRLPYVAKIRGDGKVDHRFGPLSGLPSLSRSQSIGATEILVRKSGKIDVAGSASWGKPAYKGRLGGFLIRLRRDGTPFRRFGQGGVRLPPWSFDAAALDRRGRIFGVMNEGFPSDLTVFRLTAGGGIDRSFGRGVGVPVPKASGGEGGATAAYSGARPIVLNERFFTCREECPPDPVMVAFRGRP